MNGVTILDTIEIYELAGWQFILGLAPLIVCTIVCFVRMYKAFKKGSTADQAMGVLSTEHWNPKETLIVFLGGLLSFVLMFCLDTYCPADYVETHYEVAISESTSFVEFNKTYEVLEERTTTFIVKERLD